MPWWGTSWGGARDKAVRDRRPGLRRGRWGRGGVGPRLPAGRRDHPDRGGGLVTGVDVPVGNAGGVRDGVARFEPVPDAVEIDVLHTGEHDAELLAVVTEGVGAGVVARLGDHPQDLQSAVERRGEQ